MEIITLTLIVVALFIVFGVVTYKEFSKQSRKLTSSEMKIIHTIMYRTISDMESEGIYFSDEVREKLKEQKEELICHYSGLPSVQSWEN